MPGAECAKACVHFQYSTDAPPALLLLSSQEIPDIDALDRENPLAVTEYVNDIFSYWFRVEVRT